MNTPYDTVNPARLMIEGSPINTTKLEATETATIENGFFGDVFAPVSGNTVAGITNIAFTTDPKNNFGFYHASNGFTGINCQTDKSIEFFENGNNAYGSSGGSTIATANRTAFNFTSTITGTSDDRLKHNEETIPNALEIINELKPYKYQKTREMNDASFNGDISGEWHYEIGLIAQDIQEIPYLEFAVSTQPAIDPSFESPLCLGYNNFIGLLVQGVKDLSAKVDSLEAKVKE